MKFSSKFLRYAFMFILATMMLSYCFSNIIEGATMRKGTVKACSKYRASNCPKNRCKMKCANK